MSWVLKGITTSGAYFLLLIGILESGILITAIGAYLAGFTTCLLQSEVRGYLREKHDIAEAKKNRV